MNSKIVEFDLKLNEPPENRKIKAWVVDDLNIPKVQYNINEIKRKYTHLTKVNFPEFKEKDVQLLIGTNYIDLLLHQDYIKGKEGEPIAIKTALGWTLVGGNNNITCNSLKIYNNNIHCNLNINTNDLNRNIEKFWEIESYGTLPKSALLTPNEQKALKTQEKVTEFENNRFKIGLLWKNESPCLSYNRPIAISSFKNLEKKFKKNPNFYQMFRTQINEYIDLGFAKKLTAMESEDISPTTNYIPHHGVFHIHKPGRVRVVFNASAEFQGTSLNKNLLPGVDFLNNLTDVLTKFRTGKYAVTGDIEKMFHQIKVNEKDVDALRFVWRDNPTEEISDHVMVRHLFGKVDSPCIANWALKKSAEQSSQEIQSAINNNFYMDDFLKSMSNETDLIKLVGGVIATLKTCSFRLSKFVSNSIKVLKHLPATEISPKYVNLDLNSLSSERTLGLIWNIDKDTFTFKPVWKKLPNTKRGILSIVSSTFDPLGILTPSLIEAKYIIQQLWKEKIGWDEKIPDNLYKRWELWKQEMSNISTISIPRWFGFDKKENNQIELHMFCDASKIAYGAVAYLKCTEQNQNHVTFLLAKSRLAPINDKHLTMPKLELQAAVLASRLKTSILEQLEFEIYKTYLWTDSKITLHYIQNETRKFPVFIMNRLQEIRSKTEISEWNHIPGEYNPADHCTRYTHCSKILNETNWIKGPEILHNNTYTAKTIIKNDIIPDDLIDKVQIQTIASDELKTTYIKWEHYSSFTKLVRHIALIIKLRQKWINKNRGYSETIQLNHLSVSDLRNAELHIYKQAQLQGLSKKKKPPYKYVPNNSK